MPDQAHWQAVIDITINMDSIRETAREVEQSPEKVIRDLLGGDLSTSRDYSFQFELVRLEPKEWRMEKDEKTVSRDALSKYQIGKDAPN